MATQFQLQLSFNGNPISMATKVPLASKVPMATKSKIRTKSIKCPPRKPCNMGLFEVTLDFVRLSA
jgi:hypothetical protein